MAFTVIIPARYGSTRFPGKPLADIHGQPMITHVVARAKEAGASRIIVATDDKRIAAVAEHHAEVAMTASTHESGTERLSEVISTLNIADDSVVVNVQGDEPFVPAQNIRQVALNLANDDRIAIATLSTPVMDMDEVLNPNVVKVVVNQRKEALYFSRSPIPFQRATMMTEPSKADPRCYLRHIGLYAYKAAYVSQYVRYAPSALEHLESLEQLRALWYGDIIHVDVAVAPPPVGIDTPEDLQHLIASSSSF